MNLSTMPVTGNAADVETHYQNHLAGIYSWMSGNFDEKSIEQYELFTKHGLQPSSTGIAIDMGAGHGIHTLALAKCGFSVIAVDFNKQLLDELRINTLGWGVHSIQTDIRNVAKLHSLSPEIITCCGDTISHLHDEEELAEFINAVAGKLIAGGKFVVSFRDYSIPLTGAARFIPVMSDNHKILTCLLEYEEHRVCVTDLLHLHENEKWEQHTSSYYKIRLRPELVENLLLNAAFTIDHQFIKNRMVYLIATKP